jgi:Tol biopolymer transport system component
LGQEAYVFRVDRVTGEIDLRIQSQIQLYHSLGFSPNGRRLVLMGYQDDINGQTTLFVVHDLENDETQTYTSSVDGLMLSPLYDWSADGNWLLFLMNGRVLNMVAPAYNYQLVQLHDQGYCTSMAWINR